MTALRLVSVCLGTEFFLLRLQPGRGFALLLLGALIVKHAVFQFLPISPVHAVLLHMAAAVTGLHLVVGLFGFARIQALVTPRWDTGRKWLSFGASDKATLLTIEPVMAGLLVGAAFLAVSSGEWTAASSGGAMDAFVSKGALASSTVPQGSVFYPFWYYLGFVPVDALGQAMTVYGRHLPAWFHESALMYSAVLPFLGWLGFALHGKHCDWPESPEYIAEQRARQTQASPGTLTFTTVEEVR